MKIIKDGTAKENLWKKNSRCYWCNSIVETDEMDIEYHYSSCGHDYNGDEEFDECYSFHCPVCHKGVVVSEKSIPSEVKGRMYSRWIDKKYCKKK